MKKLILITTLLCFLFWNQGTAQFQQKFKNFENYPIEIIRNTDVIKVLQSREEASVTVSEGDRINVDVPDHIDLRDREIYGMEDMFMTQSRNKLIEIKTH